MVTVWLITMTKMVQTQPPPTTHSHHNTQTLAPTPKPPLPFQILVVKSLSGFNLSSWVRMVKIMMRVMMIMIMIIPTTTTPTPHQSPNPSLKPRQPQPNSQWIRILLMKSHHIYYSRCSIFKILFNHNICSSLHPFFSPKFAKFHHQHHSHFRSSLDYFQSNH